MYGRSNGSSSKGESSFYETKLKKVIITFPKETFCHHYFEYNKRTPPGKLTKTIQWMLQVNWWRATWWVLLSGSSFNTFLVVHTFVWIHNFVFKSPCQPWELGQRIELFLRHPSIKKANQNRNATTNNKAFDTVVMISLNAPLFKLILWHLSSTNYNPFTESLPGVLGNKETKEKYCGEYEAVLGDSGTAKRWRWWLGEARQQMCLTGI